MNKICVIGGANIDICGTSKAPLREYDSNPGFIEMRYGGVGRNICQTLLRMGQNVEFVTCFASDAFGQQLKLDCEKMGLDCTKSKIVDGFPSSMYLAVMNHDGDMHVAISDMRILDELKEEDIDKVLNELDENDLLVLDANLNEDMLYYITTHAKCLKAADPVSASKSQRLLKSLPYLDIFKPNKFESKEFTGIEIVDEETASKSLDYFLDKGVKEILISMADKGVLLGTKEGKYWFTHRTIHLDNATGGGDSFLGAYLSQRLLKNSPYESTRFAISAAVTTIESSNEERRKLDFNAIELAIKNMEIKEKKI